MENEIQLNTLIENYRSYLVNDKGFTADTRDKYVGNLVNIFKKLDLQTVSDLNKEKISKNWMRHFWERVMDEGKQYSDSTRRNYLSSFKMFLKYLEEDELVPEGTSSKIELPKQTIVHVDCLNQAEQDNLRNHLSSQENLSSMRGLRDAALVYFLWSTACRINEALQLDVHADGYIYTHDPTIRSGSFSLAIDKNGKKHVYVHINGKGKRNRIIPVNETAVAYLNLYLDQRKHKRRTLFMNHANNTLPGRLTRGGAYGAIRKVLEKADIDKPKDVCTHILRHTSIQTWIEMGIPATHIITMTGHANEAGLEPYLQRSKQIKMKFADEYNPLNATTLVNPQMLKMENIFRGRYAVAIG